jgi:hypothetical protein
MRRWSGLVALALVLLMAVAGQGFGSKSGAGAKIYTDFKPVVGAWAEYQMTTKGEDPVTMRLAVVGKEGEFFWYETVMTMKDQGRMVTKMLVSGNPQETQNVKRMILKSGDAAAVEMPVTAPSEPKAEADKPKQPEGTLVNKGSEMVTVPAGTFKTDHYVYTQDKIVVDSWVAADIGPYGMVKTLTKDMEMVLTAYGKDATTLITETPQKLEIPKLPFGLPGRK